MRVCVCVSIRVCARACVYVGGAVSTGMRVCVRVCVRTRAFGGVFSREWRREKEWERKRQIERESVGEKETESVRENMCG